jgi:hypothetical protein
MMLALGLLHALLLGAAVMAWLWDWRGRGALLVGLSLTPLIGLATVAAIEMVLLACEVRGGWTWWTAQGAAAVIAILVLAWSARRGSLAGIAARVTTLPWPTQAWLAAAVVVAGPMVLGVAMATRLFPYGRWDGWAIWNLRSSFLFLADERWRDAFAPALYWSHPDYPLLLPMTVLRLLRWIGHDTTLAARVVTTLFTALLCWNAWVLVWSKRGAIWATAVLAVLVLMRTFVEVAHAQMADIPLATFLLAAIYMLTEVLERRDAGWRRWLMLGLLTGAAAWTKNEGLSLAAALTLMATLGCLLRRQWRPVGWLAVGLSLFLALIAWQRLHWHGSSDVVNPQTGQRLLEHLFSERHLIIWEVTGRQLAIDSRALWASGALLLAAALAGCTRSGPTRRAVLLAGGALALHAGACYVVYLGTHNDVGWHVQESVNRLALQVWPSLLLLLTLWSRPVRWRTP